MLRAGWVIARSLKTRRPGAKSAVVELENLFDRDAERAGQLQRKQCGWDEDGIFDRIDRLARDSDTLGKPGLGEATLGAKREQPIDQPFSHP